MCHKWPLICSVCCSHNPVLSVIRIKRLVSHVAQELSTPQEHMSSLPVFCGFVRSLVFCAMFSTLLFVLSIFFLWPLCCLSFFDLRLLTTSLVSSIFTWRCQMSKHEPSIEERETVQWQKEKGQTIIYRTPHWMLKIQ